MKSSALEPSPSACCYIMIQCTEPATPAVIVCCELPPYRFATGGRYRPLNAVSDNCPIREGRGLLSAVASRVVPTLWRRADQKKIDRRKQYSGRRRQMQADRQSALSALPTHCTIKFPLPNLSGRLSQDVGHGL